MPVVNINSSDSLPEYEQLQSQQLKSKPSTPDNDRLLSTLSSHLDLLTAGSLFLLPSLIPYLASALTTYAFDQSTSPSSSPPSILSPSLAINHLSFSPNTTTNNSSDDWNWQTTMILLLPCVGVMVPMSLFKVVSMIEEGSLQCPFRRWRQSKIKLGSDVVSSQKSPVSVCANCQRHSTPNASYQIMGGSRKYHPHGIMYGPTLNSIRRAWKVLRREPSSPLGYSPLTMNESESESEIEGEIVGKTCSSTVLEIEQPLAFSESTSLLHDLNNNKDQEYDDDDAPCMRGPCTCINNGTEPAVDKNISELRPRLSILPRPKSMLFTSLALWTVLMTFSSLLGFNPVLPTPSTSSEVQPAPAQFNNNNNGIDLQAWEPMSSNNNNVRQGGFISLEGDAESILMNEGDDAIIDDDFLSTLSDLVSKNLADIEHEIESTFPLAQIDPEVPLIEELIAESEDIEPFATVRTGVMIVNKKRDQTIQADSEDEDVSVIEQDIEEFLEPESLDALIMDPEDAVVFQDFLAQLEAEDEDVKQDEREKKQDIIKATDDLVFNSMLNNDIPCGNGGTRTFNLPRVGLLGFAFKVQDFVDSLRGKEIGDLESHQSGLVFKYLPGWSEVMILLITMCLGSILVGLAQAKILLRQLEEQSTSEGGSQKKRGASISTILSCVALVASALGITLSMIFSECWDVPSIYFVGFGIAGMILVHAWIPDSLQVEYIDQEEEYLIASDEESICDLDQEKFV